MEPFALPEQLFPDAALGDFGRKFFTELSTGCGFPRGALRPAIAASFRDWRARPARARVPGSCTGRDRERSSKFLGDPCRC
ncbi:hypothetical protein AWB66_02814 [Caballeronia telluris]|uniref:Uncharacterized protein n=1 Tax=Caballeronia telluris TaxID=326475 RepID=A0A158HZN4_9BURK|nr:hypothetical protein AWB66_02814 [Caballeronia telluris]